MFIKIGGKYFSWTDVNLMEEDYKSSTYPGYTTIRIQYREREDRTEIVAGVPIHIKQGVYEIPPEYCEQVRWFFKTFAKDVGVVDVLERWDHRVEIEGMIEAIRQQQTAQAAPKAQVLDPGGVGQGRVFKMPSATGKDFSVEPLG